MPGGQKMIPQTDHPTHFPTNTTEGGQKMIPRTTLLTHFPTNTAAGSALNASPGTISRQYHARWEGNDTSDYPPDSLPRKYRGRWARNIAPDRKPSIKNDAAQHIECRRHQEKFSRHQTVLKQHACYGTWNNMLVTAHETICLREQRVNDRQCGLHASQDSIVRTPLCGLNCELPDSQDSVVRTPLRST